MYTNQDLNHAVEKGVFTETSVSEFKSLVSSSKLTPPSDEESLRLIGGFNDIFVVIACGLLLSCSWWVLNGLNESLGYFVFSFLSWGLAEFFVLKRKMALPAIVLLLTFIGGIFKLCLSLLGSSSEPVFFVAAAAAATAGAYGHWLRFSVPITVAAGTATAIGFIAATTAYFLPDSKASLFSALFVCGLITFVLAMAWDSSDTERRTGKSDVAFWLHLLSAPLIIHPVFASLGILNGEEGLVSMAIIIVLYLFMTSISITVDRRAFMISSLGYVIYALSSIINTYGGVGYSFAITGIIMGAALLLLSAYWHRVRALLIALLPNVVESYIPKIQTA